MLRDSSWLLFETPLLPSHNNSNCSRMARLVALALLLTLACAQCPPRTVINATAAPSGSFASNAAGAAEYIPNWTCEWLINGNRPTRCPKHYSHTPPASPGTAIVLSFASYATECNWDYVTVHDGASYISPMIAALSGDQPLPAPLLATSGHVGAPCLYPYGLI